MIGMIISILVGWFRVENLIIDGGTFLALILMTLILVAHRKSTRSG